MRISPATAEVLRRATVDGDQVILPAGQLDRATYVDVNKVLVGLGGKWNRRAAAHVFDGPVGDKLADALGEGTVTPPQAFGYFPTPPPLAERLVALADVQPHHTVLEPSAGRGAIADALARIVAPSQLSLVELLPDNCAALRAKGYEVLEEDFLDAPLPATFDRVVMNPPFERKQDIAHVTRAFDLLLPGGRLVSVMSSGAMANSDRASRAFQALVDEYGIVEANPAGSFEASGTGAHTVTVTLQRGGGPR